MEYLDTIKTAASIIGSVSAIIGFCVMLITPLRERVFGICKIIDGQRCMLRSAMLDTFYKGQESNTIHQYELQNFYDEYDAYKQLGGNGFIDDVYNEVKQRKKIP